MHASARGSFADVYGNTAALANPKYEVPRLALPYLPARAHYEAGVFLGIAWWHSHYHWLVVILPRLDLVRDELAAGLPVVVPPNLRPAQRDALKAVLASLAISEEQVLEPTNRVCAFTRLIMPTQMTRPLDISRRQANFLRSALMRPGKLPACRSGFTSHARTRPSARF